MPKKEKLVRPCLACGTLSINEKYCSRYCANSVNPKCQPREEFTEEEIYKRAAEVRAKRNKPSPEDIVPPVEVVKSLVRPVRKDRINVDKD